MRTDAEREASGAEVSSTRWSARYRGSVLGRQELEGELIEDSPDALWQRGMFRRAGR